ncbi:MAG TPA: FlgD immunoglobulin-like domain containing protein [Candidatus Latescibacteria bacterium]|nr:FlgD immunoglobulin-like domain containing protein [Candidatus Latescibacterota bacterium]
MPNAAVHAQMPRPATVLGARIGLESNEAAFFAHADTTLWVSARRTLSRLAGSGVSQFDWVTYDVGTITSRPDEAITAYAVRGDRIAAATSHVVNSSSGSYYVGDGLYLSRDGGATWFPIPMTTLFADRTSMAVPGGDVQSFGVWFDGADLWAAFTTEFAVMTPDFGVTWYRYRPDSTNNPQPNPFPGDPQRQHRYRHLNYRAFDGLAVHDTIWVSTNAGINRSTDGGITWQNFDAARAGISGDFVPSVAVDTVNGILWASTQSTGLDENYLKNNPQDVFTDGVFDSLDYDLDRDGVLDGPGKNGLSWTRDGGQTWHTYVPVDDASVGVDFRAWGFAFNGQKVLVGGSIGSFDALLRSDDLGTTWRLQPIRTAHGDTSRSGQGVTDVAWQNGTIWVTTGLGLARSTDDGQTWEYILRYPQTELLGGSGVAYPGGDAAGIATYAFPSPCAPLRGTPARIVFALAATADVTIEVYDAGGARVRTLRQVSVPPGNQTVEWDGRTDGGRVVANGAYLYVITTSTGHTARGKMMVFN